MFPSVILTSFNLLFNYLTHLNETNFISIDKKRHFNRYVQVVQVFQKYFEERPCKLPSSVSFLSILIKGFHEQGGTNQHLHRSWLYHGLRLWTMRRFGFGWIRKFSWEGRLGRVNRLGGVVVVAQPRAPPKVLPRQDSGRPRRPRQHSPRPASPGVCV